MGGLRFCVCGCQSDNPIVCFGAKPTQRACARDLPQEDRRQSAEGSRKDQSTEQVSEELKARQRREKNRSQKDC